VANFCDRHTAAVWLKPVNILYQYHIIDRAIVKFLRTGLWLDRVTVKIRLTLILSVHCRFSTILYNSVHGFFSTETA